MTANPIDVAAIREGLDAKLIGKEICDLHPLILGGDPNDRSNKAALDHLEHAQLVRYWNKELRRLREAGLHANDAGS